MAHVAKNEDNSAVAFCSCGWVAEENLHNELNNEAAL